MVLLWGRGSIYVCIPTFLLASRPVWWVGLDVLTGLDLEIIMTHGSARKQGHASALLARVAALADEVGYPVYLDADEAAVGLYRRYGFERCCVERTSGMVPMLRGVSVLE
jgi:GNAT superfamily N-acetyltransferase